MMEVSPTARRAGRHAADRRLRWVTQTLTIIRNSWADCESCPCPTTSPIYRCHDREEEEEEEEEEREEEEEEEREEEREGQKGRE